MVISYFLYLFVPIQNKIPIVVIFKIGYLLVGSLGCSDFLFFGAFFLLFCCFFLCFFRGFLPFQKQPKCKRIGRKEKERGKTAGKPYSKGIEAVFPDC